MNSVASTLRNGGSTVELRVYKLVLWECLFKRNKNGQPFDLAWKAVWTMSCTRKDCWMNYGGPCFLTVVWFGSPPPPTPVSKLDRRYTGSLRKKDDLPTWGKGMGVRRSQTIRRRENLVLCTKLNTIWLYIFALVPSVEGGMHLSWTRYFGNLWGWGAYRSSAAQCLIRLRYQYSDPWCVPLLYSTVHCLTVYCSDINTLILDVLLCCTQ